ncbi:hypothetical protein NMG60_11022410 [Bertholletia excelsa]
MCQVGEKAYNMGGCKESSNKCTSKSCRGYEVDIMHFSVGNAVLGRLYGGNVIDNREGNGGDNSGSYNMISLVLCWFGDLFDTYARNPHCRNLDGLGPSRNDSSAQNDWKGYVEEDSPYSTSGKKGTFYFEFSRPLRTMDQLQQDVQFSIDQSTKFSVAFWYPVDGKPWHGSGHYTVSCDWVPLDVSPGTISVLRKAASQSAWDVTSAFALLLSVVSFCVSVFVKCWVSKSRGVSFVPLFVLQMVFCYVSINYFQPPHG